jgi:hypothetical protein
MPTSTTLTETSSSLYLPIDCRERSELDAPMHNELAHFLDEARQFASNRHADDLRLFPSAESFL